MTWDEFQLAVQRQSDLNEGLIERAYRIAQKAHQGQRRKSGEEYIIHPLSVAHILLQIGASEYLICAGLLHDTLEDGEDKPALEEEIYRFFGEHMLFLVYALSKNEGIINKQEQQKKYLQQIERALQRDICIFFLKMADLLHNMKTISHLSPKKQEKWIHELQYGYLPLFSQYASSVPPHFRESYARLRDIAYESIFQYARNEKTSHVSLCV